MKTSIATALFTLCCVASAAAETTFQPWSYTEKDLFPSAIVSTATVDWNGDEETPEDKTSKGDELPVYGDENGWLGVHVEGLKDGAEVEAEISVDGFMKPSRWKGKVTKTDKGQARIFPKAAWDYAALRKVRQQEPVTATFKLTVNGKALPDETETCNIKSINDCPFYVLWDEEGEENDDVTDFSWLFAAYVNENHPKVADILKEALESKLVNSFTGYQSGDPEQVILQVFAVWNALQRRGIKYSDISTTTPSKFVISQTVRFLDESLAATQANCVDGSTLLASVLRKIGLDVYLVMVPGHCYLAFADGSGDDAQIHGLETTMLGNDNLKPAKALAGMPEKAKAKEFKASFATFAAAVDTGDASLEEHAEAFESGEEPGTQMISVEEARKFGIAPIASGNPK